MKRVVTQQEIEMTALLTFDQFFSLQTLFTKQYKKTKSQKRFMVKFHKDKIDVRYPLDIRYKWTNGEHELVVKKGEQGSQSREEMTISLGKVNQLDKFIQLFSFLGYNIGNAMYREIERFETESIEASLVTVYPYYCIEVESLGARTKKEAVAQVLAFFKVYDLEPLPKNKYQSFLRLVDREVNLHFLLSEYPEIFLRKAEWKERVEKTIFS